MCSYAVLVHHIQYAISIIRCLAGMTGVYSQLTFCADLSSAYDPVFRVQPSGSGTPQNLGLACVACHGHQYCGKRGISFSNVTQVLPSAIFLAVWYKRKPAISLR
ncbi:MAG: hypothetical protein NTZ54_17030, partial [Alphaproteobacteria bacterium]|nr:hypothetical protein [Alphaproteobacteria bacterium]